jgi:hypothetical protein
MNRPSIRVHDFKIIFAEISLALNYSILAFTGGSYSVEQYIRAQTVEEGSGYPASHVGYPAPVIFLAITDTSFLFLILLAV